MDSTTKRKLEDGIKKKRERKKGFNQHANFEPLNPTLYLI
jgi:hypothetical protein